MLDALLDKLLRPGKSAPSYAGALLTFAQCRARARGYAEIDVVDVLETFVDLVDVTPMLERRGIVVADVMAIVEQLVAERPRLEELGPKPAISARLETVCQRSVAGDQIALRPFFENLAAALPPELAFFRPALTAAAPDLAAFFSASLSRTPDGQLTLEAWSPDMKAVIALMQRTADTKARAWGIGVYHLFRAVMINTNHHDAWKARGLDPAAMVVEAMRRIGAKYAGEGPVFEPPADFVPSLTPALYALFIRAERYAAEDRTNVMLRHVLAALHDEPDYAPEVEKLLG